MTDLDEFFGARESLPTLPPRPSGEETLARSLTSGSRWHCEERIKPALDAFFECWPDLEPRSPDVRRTHYAAMRQLVEEVGESGAPSFIRWAVRETPPHLTVKTARSVLFLVAKWRARQERKAEYEPCPDCGAILGHGPNCRLAEEEE